MKRSSVSSAPPVVLLEFNELTPQLLEDLIADGRLPNFARLRDRSAVFTTDAGEDPPKLEPWIQWVTVHTGMPFDQHGVYHLNDGQQLDAPRVWDYVCDAGASALVLGSMNAKVRPGFRGAFLPDPWADPGLATPAALETYARVIGAHVQEHTNDRVPLAARDYASFAAVMARRGLSPRTALAVGRQLAGEVVGERRGIDNRWQRSVVPDLLQFDLFRWFFRRLQPRLSTFFLNSTAHLQHKYWWYHQPDAFPAAPSADDRRSYGGAVRFGYEAMDRLLGRFLSFAPEATFVFCTALSQQPAVAYAETGGKLIYRPRRFEEVLAAAGVTDALSCAPTMAEEFYAYFDSVDAATRASAQIRQLTVDARPVIEVRQEGDALYLSCELHDPLADNAVMTGPQGELRFFDLFYLIRERLTGRHHREGMLWISGGRQPATSPTDVVPLTVVAPTILELCGVPRPEWMRDPLPVAPHLQRSSS